MPVILCCFPTRSARSLPSSLAAFAPPTTTCAPPRKPYASIATTTPVIQIPITAIGTSTSTNCSLTLGLAPDPVLQQQLIASSHRSTNWRRILPDTRNTLLLLKQQYRLAVISNSDGGIQDAIGAAGIADCFECIIDSAHVGIEKPTRRSSAPPWKPCRFSPAKASTSATSTPSMYSARVRSACEPSSSIPSAFTITRTARVFRRSPNCLTCCGF